MFTCPPSLLASQIMAAYCKKKGLAIGTVRFVFDGDSIARADTPASLKLEDGDSIDAMMERAGD